MNAESSPVRPPEPRPIRVLVCDDQADVLDAMYLLLKGEGHQAVTVQSPQRLLEVLGAEPFDVILADLNYTRDTTSGDEGLDLLKVLEASANPTPVIVMTAWGSIGLAVEAMRRGACDFIEKPWDNARVIEAVRKHAESGRRRQSEIEIAAVVQQRLLPRAAAGLATLDYAGRCIAARGVGGDYYDFLDAGDGSVAIVLADVSGKGIPAALLMANLQACFRAQPAASLRQPAALLETINRHFVGSTDADRFATVFYGLYEDRTRRLHYANCGHCAPMLLRADGELEFLEPTATLLGAFPAWRCGEAEVAMNPGDTLLLYSDGVPEAADDSGEEFGEPRLLQALQANTGGPAAAIGRSIVDEVASFSSPSRSDDVTVVVLRGLP